MIIVTNRVEVAPDGMSEAMDWAERLWKNGETAGLSSPKGWLLKAGTGNIYRFSFVGQYAGHGITFSSAKILSRIKGIKEFNIGHFLIAESIFIGMKKCIKIFKKILKK